MFLPALVLCLSVCVCLSVYDHEEGMKTVHVIFESVPLINFDQQSATNINMTQLWKT